MSSNAFRSEAIRIARQILAGELDPNLGCGMIAAIAEKNGHPESLTGFSLLGHEQYGHEHVGITAESCIPAILESCRELISAMTYQVGAYDGHPSA